MAKKKKNKKKISPVWYDRAIKIGLSPEQIDSFVDEKTLIAACNRLKPQATTYAPVETKPAPVPKMGEVGLDSFNSVISLARSRHTSRTNYDEGQINSFMVKNRINPKQVKTILIRRNMEPNKANELVTCVTIGYVK